ncbi:MAG: glycosyltransferase [Ginsengibacter sp.]
MKILCIIDSFNVGGAQRQLCMLAKMLSKTNDVQLLVFHPHSSFLEEEIRTLNIPITKILKKSRFDVIFIFRLIRFINENKFDLSISFLDTPNFYNELARLFKAVPKIIISQRSAYFKKDLSVLKRFFEYFHVFADMITTNSITQAERMKEYFPILAKKIIYTPNTYSFYKNFKSEFNNNNKFIVLSNLNHYKNPLSLVQAIKEFKQKYTATKFCIYWYGRFPITDYDKQNFSKVLSIVDEYKLNNNIHFCGITNNPYEEIIKYDAIIHLSDFEGCPNSVCEAMAVKKPAILSNVCDHKYLVSNNNGFLTDQKNPEDIADKIYNFISLSESEKKIMGERSFDYIIENMSEGNTLKKWLSVIENVTKS